MPELILGEGVVLRRPEPDVAGEIFAAIDSDRERLRRFLPWVDTTRTLQDELEYIKFVHDQWRQLITFDFAIFNGAKDYVGNIGVHSISWPNERCELGYWVAGPFEGKGFISAAVRVLEKTLFEHGFHRIAIRCSTENLRSAKVPERNGYVREGTLRGDIKLADKFHDTLVFSKLRHERS